MPVRVTFPDSDIVLEYVADADPRYVWDAYHDGGDRHHCGSGRTKEEAIADLGRLDQERAEALEEEAARQFGFQFGERGP